MSNILREKIAVMGGLLQSGSSIDANDVMGGRQCYVQGELCTEVKGGWYPVRFGEPPEHIRLDPQSRSASPPA